MWISNPESANGPYADSAYTLGLRLNSWCSLLFSNLFVLIVFHFWRFCSSWIRIHKFSWVRFLFVPNIGKIPRIVYNDPAPTGSRTALLPMHKMFNCCFIFQAYASFRRFCMDVKHLPTDLHILFSDILQVTTMRYTIVPKEFLQNSKGFSRLSHDD